MANPSDGQTSKLLISEPPLLVLPSLAVLVGLNEAIFLQQLHYWLLQSGKDRDGKRWIYNTYDDWQVQLPFWSVRTIRRIVGELESKKLVLSTTKYNNRKVDQTKWYTLEYRVLDSLTERADQVANVDSWGGQDEPLHVDRVATSVPETTKQETTDTEIESSKSRMNTEDVLKRYDEPRQVLVRYAEDLARELNDQSPLSSTTTRLVDLYRGSGLELDEFISRILAARAITQERSGSIKAEATGEGWGRKPKVPYFLKVLESLTMPADY